MLINILNFNILKVIIYITMCILFIGFCILDGFDIGVCILLPFLGKDDIDKRMIINSISLNWDGNQVWFITLVGLIFSSFPNVYSIISNYLYISVNIMIFSFMIRPISLDLRSKFYNYKFRKICDFFISLSSLFIILSIGYITSCVIEGIPFYYDTYLRSIKYLFNIKINCLNIFLPFLFLINSLIQGCIYLKLKIEDNFIKKIDIFSNIIIFIQLINILVILFLIFNLNNGYLYIKDINYNKFNKLKNFVFKGIGFWKNNYIKNYKLIIIPLFYIISSIFTLIFNLFKKNILSLIFSSINILIFIMFIFITMFPFLIPSSYYPNDSLIIWENSSNYNCLKLIVFFIFIIFPIIIGYTIYTYKKTSFKINKLFIKNNKNILY